jgi:SAM-dependent methyltransferase
VLVSLLRWLKQGSVELNYGRDAVASIVKGHAASLPAGGLSVLDVGLGSAQDLMRVAAALDGRPLRLSGVESHAPSVQAARELGIEVRALDIERERLPFGDGLFDVVIANQVLEHTKELFWIFSEIARVLKPGGAFVVGVPNLASLHSRVMLLAGMQPSPVEVLGPHVRGFTKGGFVRFAQAGGFFTVRAVRGANFYPFPPLLARPLARALPTFAVSLFFLCVRTGREGSFLRVLDERNFETPYFMG